MGLGLGLGLGLSEPAMLSWTVMKGYLIAAIITLAS